MKHFEIKNILAGAGGGDDEEPAPPTLNPPALGAYSVASTYSHAETIDLISDGPIEGLVNSNGYLLNESSYLQGLYLEDTAVEVTNEDYINSVDLEYSLLGGTCFTGSINDAFQKIDDYSRNLYSYETKYDFQNEFDETDSVGFGASYLDINLGNSLYWKTNLPKKGRSLISLSTDSSPNKYGDPKNFQSTACIDITDYDGLDGFSNSWIQYKTDETGSNTSASENNIISGNKTVFFEKQCENSFYMETCLQMSNWDISKNPLLDQKRTKIVNGITDFIDVTTGSNRFMSYFAKSILAANGLVQDVDDDGNEQLFDYEDITQAIEKKLTSTKAYGMSVNFENWIFPYIFISYENDQVLSGFDPELHSGIFINDDIDVSGYSPSGTGYQIDDVFSYDQLYYEVIEEFTGSNGLPTSGGYDLLTGSQSQNIREVDLDEPEIYTNLTFDIVSEVNYPEGYSRDIFNFIIPVLEDEGAKDGSGNDISRLWNGKVRGFYLRKLDVEATTTLNDQISASTFKKIVYLAYLNQVFIPDSLPFDPVSMQFLNITMDNVMIDYMKAIKGLGIYTNAVDSFSILSPKKYNYSNILMEFRNGDQFQEPLDFFRDIYIDHTYNSSLLGPFSKRYTPYTDYADADGVQRLWYRNADGDTRTTLLKKVNGSPRLNFARNSIPAMDADYLLAYEETSQDKRTADKGESDDPEKINYSDWDKRRENFNERAQPITHIIQNPNVDGVFFTLSLKNLYDTAHQPLKGTSGLGLISAGSKIPTVLNIRVEIGLVDDNGDEDMFFDRFFQIVSLVESPNYIDIGNPDSVFSSKKDFKDFREVQPRGGDTQESIEGQNAAGGIFEPFELPNIPKTTKSASDTSVKEDLKYKRYIKITKVSVETNSVLIRKTVDLGKVTEIISSQCNYPFSSIVGTKLDSRVFSSVPKRTFRAKLKKVKVPVNYYPSFVSGRDIRYHLKESDLKNIKKEDRKIYKGDWDGTFKFAWTDNPAWILYDMLTAVRYGLGEQITENEVNKWDLYKIARFCDAVDEEGIFKGVSDGRGGLEPRFSCNIMFNQGTKVFDAINSIAAIFRGIVFYEHGSVNFLDDRLKEPIAMFSNSNVAEGFFSYSNYKRDEKYNAVEVSYKDRNDDFKTKMEYVEDEEDISKRGLFKREIVASGITSKAMAIRAAKHLMYQTTKENEIVSFNAGTEALLCKPGDLLIIEDELKKLQTNFGRVLEVDDTNKTIRTSRIFNTNEYEKEITIYLPTGNQKKEDLDELASVVRVRLEDFEINSGNMKASPNASGFKELFHGGYVFDRYEQGYDLPSLISGGENIDGLFEQYAVYKGDNSNEPKIWYSTGASGWIFSTGLDFQHDDIYDKYIATGLNIFDFKDFHRGEDIEKVRSTKTGKRCTLDDTCAALLFNSEGSFTYESSKNDLNYFGGLQENQIDLNGMPQIRTINVTGWGGVSGIQAKEYGDIVYLDKTDPNSNLIKFIPEGSTYRFKSKNYDDQIYKVISIKEEENHSYNITASKYISGKYEKIENDIDIFGEEENLFGYKNKSFYINEINYVTLDPPDIYLKTGQDPTLTTGDFKKYYVTGYWEAIDKASSYEVVLESPDSSVKNFGSITGTGLLFYTPNYVGNYRLKVKAKPNKFSNEDQNTRYNDSIFASEQIYVATVVEGLKFEAAQVDIITAS